MAKSVQCGEERCSATVRRWRSCGWQYNCHVAYGYCDDHGGDARATREMIEHIERDHAKKP